MSAPADELSPEIVANAGVLLSRYNINIASTTRLGRPVAELVSMETQPETSVEHGAGLVDGRIALHPVEPRGNTITDQLSPQKDVYFVAPEPDDARLDVKPARAGSSARLLDRPDVTRFRQRLSLVNHTLTPHEAMVEDLLFLRQVLDGAGIDFLLVRGNDERPVVAVDWEDRKRLRTALVSACQNEPFYSQVFDTRSGRSLLIADGELADSSKARIFRLYRPRVEPAGGLNYGPSVGVQLELWAMDGDEYLLPMENSLTRMSLPKAEAVRSSVERYGLSWPTIQNMFSQHASDINFDIDIVFSWVDGNDPEFQRRWAERMAAHRVGEGDDSTARIRQIDELKYALRSIHMFAPWIRRIFIVTDSLAPEWLSEHPKITIVRSEDHFADPTVLPTHNSQAIESQLQHITGLAEHFLYSNDDMFFGRPVTPSMFFSPGGVSKFIEADVRIGLGENHARRSGFENAARVNRGLLLERFDRFTTRHLEHAAAPLRRSVLLEMEAAFPEDFARTAASRFRSSTDISVTNSLYHYYALLTGRAVEQRKARVSYIDTTTTTGLKTMEALLPKREIDFFCLNDGSFPEVDVDVRAEALTGFLERYFPIPAPWEK